MEVTGHLEEVVSTKVSTSTSSSTNEPVLGNLETTTALLPNEILEGGQQCSIERSATSAGSNLGEAIILDQHMHSSAQNSNNGDFKEEKTLTESLNEDELSKRPILDASTLQLADGSSVGSFPYASGVIRTREDNFVDSSKSNSDANKDSTMKENLDVTHQNNLLGLETSVGYKFHEEPVLDEKMVFLVQNSDTVNSKIEKTAVTSVKSDEPAQSHASDASTVLLASVGFANIQNGSREAKKSEDNLLSVPSHGPDKAHVNVTPLPPKIEEPGIISEHAKKVVIHRGLVDTAAPFESVKEAVSKFGGIVDWKAHKIKTEERKKYFELELEKAHEEIPKYKQQSDAAESAKAEVLKELDSMKRLIEELKLNLEKSQTEETQAKQDSELARLRVEEIEQGIASEASVAAKAQFEVAQSRHKAAVQELKLVRDELESLKTEYVALLNERNLASKRAEEVVSALKESEKTVEELTLELIVAKESLESAHTAHMEAEEKRIGAAMAKEQDELGWERELKEAEEEVQKLSAKVESVKDLKSKLNSASQLLDNLKTELAAFVESNLTEVNINMEEEEDLTGKLEEMKKIETNRKASLASVKKEIEDVKISLEKAKDDVKCLKVAAVSLNSELEKEKAALTSLRQREGMASIAVAALESEVERTKAEIESVQMKEKEAKEKMVELPKALQQAALEADQAKAMVRSAREEHRKVKETAEQAKAAVITTESRLHAALKEIEAAKASETLALAAAKALQESESASEPDSPAGITLSLDQYYALSRTAHEAEEQANMRIAEALAQIQVAKESELRNLEKLEEANKEMTERKEALRVATEKAERAKQGKLGAEQELRKWRAENEQRRRTSDAVLAEKPPIVNPPRSPLRSFEGNKEPLSFDGSELSAVRVPQVPEQFFLSTSFESPGTKLKVKKKRSLFPRIVMSLSRRKAHSK